MLNGSKDTRTRNEWLRFSLWPRGVRAWLALAIELSPILAGAAGGLGLPWLAWALVVLWLPTGLVLLGAGYATATLLFRLEVEWFETTGLDTVVLAGVGLIAGVTYVVAAQYWAALLCWAGAFVARGFKRLGQGEGDASTPPRD